MKRLDADKEYNTRIWGAELPQTFRNELIKVYQAVTVEKGNWKDIWEIHYYAPEWFKSYMQSYNSYAEVVGVQGALKLLIEEKHLSDTRMKCTLHAFQQHFNTGFVITQWMLKSNSLKPYLLKSLEANPDTWGVSFLLSEAFGMFVYDRGMELIEMIKKEIEVR